ncbi:hypothetical protein D9M72_625510 [compost metagenome]
MECGVERRRRVAFAGKALHPDAIRGEDMIERRKHRAEEGALALPQFVLREFRRCSIKPAVGPVVVVGEHAKVIVHLSLLWGRKVSADPHSCGECHP